MGNILTYTDTSRLRSFQKLPFSPVDSLILSEVSYYNFENSPFCASDFSVFLSQWFCGDGAGCTLRGMITAENDRLLMASLAQGGRHGDLRACGYVSVLDEAQTQQFSAITFEIEPGTYYIAFRGTDNTVVGWKEDMALYYLPEIPAQAAARDYAIGTMERLPGRFYLGGHSKGGNLAIYCATHLPEHLQERLITVFDHDGPGFPTRFYEQQGYQTVAPKIYKTLPRSSVIGLLLEDGTGYHVVDSSAEAILQHDPFTWLVEGEGFLPLEEVDSFALHVDLALTQWTEGMELETRKKLVDLIFDVIFSTGISAFVEMSDGTIRHVGAMLNYLKETTAEEKHLILDAVKRLLTISAGEAHEMLDEKLERKRQWLHQELEKSREIVEQMMERKSEGQGSEHNKTNQ